LETTGKILTNEQAINKLIAIKDDLEDIMWCYGAPLEDTKEEIQEVIDYLEDEIAG